MTSVGLFASDKKKALVLALALTAATLALFNSLNRAQFINYDDDLYVTENLHVQKGLGLPGLIWAFRSTEVSNWHPITWIAHMVDYQLFGMKPAGHHLVSVLFHAANAVLLFVLLFRATGFLWRSLVVAALFAMHPLNVQSVAWVAERKNLLSTFFWLLTMGAYGFYTLKPNWKRYVPVLVLFALGLMCKPMIITLPFTLLLLDYWPLRRIRYFEDGFSRDNASDHLAKPQDISWLFVEKIPLFALAMVSAAITIRAQASGGSLRGEEVFSLPIRLANGLHSYTAYIAKGLWPIRLSIFYPHSGNSLPGWKWVLSALVIAGITVFAVSRKRSRFLLVGWLWYLGTLVPVIGIIQVGDQAMADRYAYVPLIGLFVAAVWGFSELLPKLTTNSQAWLGTMAVLVLAGCAALTTWQLRFWQNDLTLWGRALQIAPNSPVVHDNLGEALDHEGQRTAATAHYRTAIGLNFRDPVGHYNMGLELGLAGKCEEAVREYILVTRATTNRSLGAKAYNNMGVGLVCLHEREQAKQAYARAIELDPYGYKSYINLGLLLADEGKLEDSAQQFLLSLKVVPNDAAYFHLGEVREKQNRLAEALEAYQSALTLSPNLSQARKKVEEIKAKLS